METPLRDLLTSILPADAQGYGQWAWLAHALGLDRRAIDDWLRTGRVPARRVDAVCDLLKAPDDVRAELRRRAGFQVLSTVTDAGPVAVQEAV